LDECLRDDLTPHRLPPTWISHEEVVYQADDGSLALLNTHYNNVSLLVSNHTLVRIRAAFFVLEAGKLADDSLAPSCTHRLATGMNFRSRESAPFSLLRSWKLPKQKLRATVEELRLKRRMEAAKCPMRNLFRTGYTDGNSGER